LGFGPIFFGSLLDSLHQVAAILLDRTIKLAAGRVDDLRQLLGITRQQGLFDWAQIILKEDRHRADKFLNHRTVVGSCSEFFQLGQVSQCLGIVFLDYLAFLDQIVRIGIQLRLGNVQARVKHLDVDPANDDNLRPVSHHALGNTMIDNRAINTQTTGNQQQGTQQDKIEGKARLDGQIA